MYDITRTDIPVIPTASTKPLITKAPKIPCVILDKKDNTRKLLVGKNRGMYIYTTDDKVFGLLTKEEVIKYYSVLNNKSLLNGMLFAFGEKMESFCDTTEG